MTELWDYFGRALLVLKGHKKPALILILTGLLCYTLPRLRDDWGLFMLSHLSVMFVILPLIYGKYAETLKNNPRVPYGDILRKYWLDFILVNLVIGSPLLVTAFLSIFLPVFEVVEAVMLLLIVASTIYVTPLVFMSNRSLSCIPLGIKCLLGNFRFSSPLVVLTLASSLLVPLVSVLCLRYVGRLASVIVGYLGWAIGTIVDVALFITVSIILQEKLLGSGSYYDRGGEETPCAVSGPPG